MEASHAGGSKVKSNGLGMRGEGASESHDDGQNASTVLPLAYPGGLLPRGSRRTGGWPRSMVHGCPRAGEREPVKAW